MGRMQYSAMALRMSPPPGFGSLPGSFFSWDAVYETSPWNSDEEARIIQFSLIRVQERTEYVTSVLITFEMSFRISFNDSVQDHLLKQRLKNDHDEMFEIIVAYCLKKLWWTHFSRTIGRKVLLLLFLALLAGLLFGLFSLLADLALLALVALHSL